MYQLQEKKTVKNTNTWRLNNIFLNNENKSKGKLKKNPRNK